MLKSVQSEYEQDSQNTFKKHQKRFKNKKITKSNFNEVLSNSFHKVSKKKTNFKINIQKCFVSLHHNISRYSSVGRAPHS